MRTMAFASTLTVVVCVGWLLSTLEASSGGLGFGGGGVVKQQSRDEFEFFIFRQIWPATTCMFPGANTCSIARNISTWVIHGLWPSKHDAIGPAYCNKSVPFNFNSIKHLLPLLLEFWPNLYTNTPLDSFW
jgi:hypothetical protein